MQTFCVHVQNLAGDAITYHVANDASVGDLKHLISERIGVTIGRQRLILQTGDRHSELADATCALAACGVAHDSALHLFVDDRGLQDLVFERAAGSKGNGELQFSSPEGLCLHGDVLFVSDWGGHCVQALRAADLSFLFRMGSEGSGNGQLRKPRGVCAAGNLVFVADYDNRRVAVFSAIDGSFVQCSAEFIGRPFGICASASGEWLCVAVNSNRVHVLHVPTLELVRSIGCTAGDGGAARFDWPRGLGFSPDDELLFVADMSAHCVRVIRFADGTDVRRIGSNGNGLAQFSNPRDVRVSGAHLLVADYGNHRVQILTLDGEHVRTIGGKRGSGGGEFYEPSALCVSPAGDRLYVLEEGGNRVQLFSL